MKKRIAYAVLLLSLGGVLFFSCKKEQPAQVYMGYDYFPVKKGHFVIYQCDSIVFDSSKHTFPRFDTFNYQVKEVIDSVYNNKYGQPTLRIVRYKRTDTSVAWNNISAVQKTWTANLLSNMGIRQENNNSYVKLVFPMSLNEMWNGNTLNNIGEWNYKYSALHTPYVITNVYFDSTLTVLQQKDSSLYNYQYYIEQYATSVGLIHKVVIDYKDTLSHTLPPSTDSATSGIIFYSETYLSSGN